MAISEYGADLMAEVITGQVSVPSNLYLALSTKDITETMDGSDLTEPGGGYVRRTVAMGNTSWADATNGFCVTTVDIVYPVATANWGMVTSWALCTTSGVGTGEIVFYSPFNEPYNIFTHQQITIEAGALGVGLIQPRRAL